MIPLIIQSTTNELESYSFINSAMFQNPIYFWIAIIELLIILFLLKKLRKNYSSRGLNNLNKESFRKLQKEEIDMDNLMKSINNSRDLYKELSKKCHPDKFINTDKQEIAEKIFQEIARNKRNFAKLNILKLRAVDELNINFKI